MSNSRTEVLQRRLKVSSLKIRGYSVAEIAQALNTTIDTVHNDTRVILSGKNKAILKHTMKEMIAQLHLNARERTKYLWRIVEEAEKHYVKVQALRELRLNDERITAKLPEPGKDSLEEDDDDMDKKEMLEQLQAIRKRFDLLRQRRLGMQRTLKELFERGDMEGLRSFIGDDLDLAPGS